MQQHDLLPITGDRMTTLEQLNPNKFDSPEGKRQLRHALRKATFSGVFDRRILYIWFFSTRVAGILLCVHHHGVREWLTDTIKHKNDAMECEDHGSRVVYVVSPF